MHQQKKPDINEVVRSIFTAEQEIKAHEESIKKNKELLRRYFDNNPEITEISVAMENYEVSGDLRMLSAKIAERVSISYDPDMIMKKLDKEICVELISKSYSISDISGLISLMKKYGVKPDEFKKYLIISKSVNVDRLKNLFAIGDVTLKDLAGCYVANISKSVSVKVKAGGKD